MSAAFDIVPAGEEHLPAILAIYNHEVAYSTAIWNDSPADLENRRLWWRSRTEAGHPVLVAVGEGRVLGYAGYGPFRPYDGYRDTVELSVYVETGARRMGIATALMQALENEARRRGVRVMLGGIAAENDASIRLHRRLGFVETARMPEVGQKFGRFLDLVFMQKILK